MRDCVRSDPIYRVNAVTSFADLAVASIRFLAHPAWLRVMSGEQNENRMLLDCTLSVDIWDFSNPGTACVCIKRKVRLAIAPFPALKLMVQPDESKISEAKQQYSALRKSITHKTGIFRVHNVLAIDAGRVEVSSGIDEKSALALEQAVEYYCTFFGFKKLIPDVDEPEHPRNWLPKG